MLGSEATQRQWCGTWLNSMNQFTYLYSLVTNTELLRRDVYLIERDFCFMIILFFLYKVSHTVPFWKQHSHIAF